MMNRIAFLLFLSVASNFAGIKALGYSHTTRSSSTTGTTSTSSYAPKPPSKICECLDTKGLQKDIDQILNELDEVSKQERYLTIIPLISSKVSNIQSAVQNKTCQCKNEDRLLELEEKSYKSINDVLNIANRSAACACNSTFSFFNITKIILDKINKAKDLIDSIFKLVTDCVKGIADIKDKFDKLVGNESGTCELSRLEDDNVVMKKILDAIYHKVCEIRDRGCGCKDEIANVTKKVCDKIDSVLKKLDNISKNNDCNLDSVNEALEKMDKKLDKIIEKNTTTVIGKCDCVTYNQFITILPLYCEKQQKEKKVLPWELPKKDADELVCEYEMCIKVAIHDLDDWFKHGIWNKMPAMVKKILISIYCKMGFNDMKYFFHHNIKAKLEDGDWKEAAKLMRETLWAKRRDPDAAKELIDKLEKVE